MLCTNGVYVLTNYVLTDKICMEVTTFRPGLEISFDCTNGVYVLTGLVLTGDDLYRLSLAAASLLVGSPKLTPAGKQLAFGMQEG